MSYLIIIERDETTDGQVCYLAYHPELSGCMSDGATPDEAMANLCDARELYISHLRADHLPIPWPLPLDNITIDFGSRMAYRKG